MFYRKYGKRFLDITLSLLALLICSPLFLILYFLVRMKLGNPVFFRQERAGLHGKTFCIYKFRSMNSAMDNEGNLLPDEERLTRFGNLMRVSSLDELPQFWNIFIGDISIIGPRALLVPYMDDYTEMELKRHEVKPGIVGLAALYGRQNQKWKQKFEKDIYYVEHMSFILDIKIFFKAIGVVFSRKDIYQDSTNKEDFYGREKYYEHISNRSTSR